MVIAATLLFGTAVLVSFYATKFSYEFFLAPNDASPPVIDGNTVRVMNPSCSYHLTQLNHAPHIPITTNSITTATTAAAPRVTT